MTHKIKISIYVDDLRPCPLAANWKLAKTADEALTLLREFQGQVDILSLDHDLQDTHTPERHGKWLVNQMVEEGLFVDRVYLHTSNPVGRTNMYSLLTQAKNFGVFPSEMQVTPGPMPWVNMATGELIID